MYLCHLFKLIKVMFGSILAAKGVDDVAYNNILDHTFLGDRCTTIREYLVTNGSSIMEEEPPKSLKFRYGGWHYERKLFRCITNNTYFYLKKICILVLFRCPPIIVVYGMSRTYAILNVNFKHVLKLLNLNTSRAIICNKFFFSFKFLEI